MTEKCASEQFCDKVLAEAYASDDPQAAVVRVCERWMTAVLQKIETSSQLAVMAGEDPSAHRFVCICIPELSRMLTETQMCLRNLRDGGPPDIMAELNKGG